MLAMFHTRLRKPADMPARDFYALWHAEGVASLEAQAAGVVKAIWKVAGKDEVIGVLEVPDGNGLDRGLFELAIWKQGMTHLVDEIEWTVLRPYENWVEHLGELSGGGPDAAV